jgi:hypothetical protein
MKRTILFLLVMTAPVAAERERLEVIAPSGRILAAVDGDESSVEIRASVDHLLWQPDAHLTLTHNHPHGVGLSGDDLEQLVKPGVDRIVAVGTDGSRYEAARGPRFAVRDFLGWQYPHAFRRVHAEIALVYRPTGSSSFDLAWFAPHLAALALRDIGVLDYHATLGLEFFNAQCRYMLPLRRAAAAAAAELAREAGERERRLLAAKK